MNGYKDKLEEERVLKFANQVKDFDAKFENEFEKAYYNKWNNSSDKWDLIDFVKKQVSPYFPTIIFKITYQASNAVVSGIAFINNGIEFKPEDFWKPNPAFPKLSDIKKLSPGKTK